MADTSKFSLSNINHLLALGFGSGLAPKAPGTFGTLAAIPFYLVLSGLTPWLYGVMLLVTSFIGFYICGKAAADVGVDDHPAIVWDEFVGFFITMFLIEPSIETIAVGFVLFRVFDIFKPWPISIADKKLHGGLGIMLDDMLAGVFACILMHLIF